MKGYVNHVELEAALARGLHYCITHKVEVEAALTEAKLVVIPADGAYIMYYS